MYLPLTGQHRRNKGRGEKVKVGPVNTGAVYRPTPAGQSHQIENQEAQKNEQRKSNQNNPTQGASEETGYGCQGHMSQNMSSQDFISMHNNAAADMIEGVKEIMALKLLEKTLEAINKIMD